VRHRPPPSRIYVCGASVRDRELPHSRTVIPAVTDVPYAGGKGAKLGEQYAAGVPVPAGFVVGVPAYSAFCAEGGLRERLDAALADLDVEDTAALEAAAAAAGETVARTQMPGWIEDAIRAAYAELSGKDPEAPVAVRSLATEENTAAAPLAGMNETYLNVRGASAVVNAVHCCRRSLFGARTVY
jgi:pyruvate,water dikinase